jgi:hypothetical protein
LFDPNCATDRAGVGYDGSVRAVRVLGSNVTNIFDFTIGLNNRT